MEHITAMISVTSFPLYVTTVRVLAFSCVVMAVCALWINICVTALRDAQMALMSLILGQIALCVPQMTACRAQDFLALVPECATARWNVQIGGTSSFPHVRPMVFPALRRLASILARIILGVSVGPNFVTLERIATVGKMKRRPNAKRNVTPIGKKTFPSMRAMVTAVFGDIRSVALAPRLSVRMAATWTLLSVKENATLSSQVWRTLTMYPVLVPTLQNASSGHQFVMGEVIARGPLMNTFLHSLLSSPSCFP